MVLLVGIWAYTEDHGNDNNEQSRQTDLDWSTQKNHWHFMHEKSEIAWGSWGAIIQLLHIPKGSVVI